MEIDSRRLNAGERFCCSKNDIKKAFRDSDISINFGLYGGRNFNTNPKWYKGPKIKGKIIASLSVSNIDSRLKSKLAEKYNTAKYGHTMLSFYVLKNEEFIEELHKEFISKILPKIYDAYLAHKEGNPEKISGGFYMDIEFYDGKFFIHDGINHH